MGPAIIGAIALSQAEAKIRQKLADSSVLRKALAEFAASPAHVPAAQRPAVEAAVHAVGSGPLGANAVPATVTLPHGEVVPFNPLHQVAFDALSHSYSLGFLVCGAAALLAALLAVVAIRAHADETMLDLELLDD
jgi:hypothetical protein